MKQFNTLSKISIVSLLFFAGCKKSDNIPSFTPGLNVYMAGESNGAAVYWKNGQQVNLANNGISKSIAVVGQDIYIAGQTAQSIQGKTSLLATVWKNGIQQNLTNSGSATAYGIGITGNDVYAIGSIVDSPGVRAVFWKNGIQVNLAPLSEGYADAIGFSGTDIYVAGILGNTRDTAVYWKNGIITPYLSISDDGLHSGMSFSGADLYSVGKFGGKAIFYKNRQITYLENNYNTYSAATGITIIGSDVYISGLIFDPIGNINAVYWKNGALTILEKKYDSAIANGIAVAGNDVYVIGTVHENSTYTPVYWKNGVQQQLSPSGSGNAIAVGN